MAAEMAGWMERTMSGISTFCWTAFPSHQLTCARSRAQERTVEKGELELRELLLGHGNAHLAVAFLRLVSPPPSPLLLPLALDERLERGRDSPMHEPVQTLVHSTPRSSARDGACACRGWTKEVEKVELVREGESRVEGGDVLDEGERGGLVRRVGERGREVVGVRVWRRICFLPSAELVRPPKSKAHLLPPRPAPASS